jgi:hypothetical protein
MVTVNSRIPLGIVAGISAACVFLVGPVGSRAAGCDPAGNIRFI